MISQAASKPLSVAAHPARALGFYTAVLTAVLTLGTFVIAYLTPPLSGPGCLGSCYSYPYTDIASRFPRDYIWMVPAIVLTLTYFVLAACIHDYAPEGKKVFSHIGLALALVAAAVLIVDYFVQLSVIQPSLVNGETDGIALLTQYNPHGLFIALEEIGYLLMGVAFLFFAPVFAGQNRVEKAIRWIFSAAGVLTVLSLAVITFQYGIFREYRYEIIVISIDWITLIVAGILLSVVFRRAMRQP